MMDKEKDLAYLKFNLHEMKTHFNEKEDEVHSLKAINKELQNEMKFVKELNLELKGQFEKEINVRRDNDKLMETKISSLQREVMDTKNKETLSLKSQLENFNIEANEKSLSCHKDIETLKSNINSSLTDDMVKLNQSVKKIQTEIRSTRSHVDKSLNKETEEMIDLTSHIRNIENILFCNEPPQNGCIKFKWFIQNYQYYSDTCNCICTAISYKEVSGYCFQLLVQWSGKKKGNLGLCLKLCRGRFNHKVKPFRIPFTLQIQGNEGNEKIRTVTLSEIDENPDSFTIHPNENKARKMFVCPNMLVKPSLQDYIINDTLLVSCVFEG